MTHPQRPSQRPPGAQGDRRSRVLMSAGEGFTDPLVDALPPALRDAAVFDTRVLVGVDLVALERITTERIRASHSELERGLVRDLRERAQGAGAAALGLSEVVGALNQARVAHLIYDPFIRYRGSVGDDGSLYADDETAPSDDATPDDRLTERIVERALETGARVTPSRAPPPMDSPRHPASPPCSAGRWSR